MFGKDSFHCAYPESKHRRLELREAQGKFGFFTLNFPQFFSFFFQCLYCLQEKTLVFLEKTWRIWEKLKQWSKIQPDVDPSPSPRVWLSKSRLWSIIRYNSFTPNLYCSCSHYHLPVLTLATITVWYLSLLLFFSNHYRSSILCSLFQQIASSQLNIWVV